MTPLEKIRKGILEENWDMVVDGYNSFTDSPIERKKPKKVKRTVVDRISDGLQPPIPESNKEKVVARTEQFQVKKRINMFADTGENPPEYSERDRIIDEANRAKGTAVKPKPYTPKIVTCFVCNKQYKINPAFALGGGYRCDRCSKSK